ncbi:hypothetical protein CKO08_05970 [Halorhodospira halochloris]|nr:hypothetical protein [Halorhodospira halochloris]
MGLRRNLRGEGMDGPSAKPNKITAGFLHQLLDCQAAALCVLDATGRLTYLNSAACRLLGHSDRTALLGTSFDTLLDTERIEPSATAFIEQLIQVAVSGEPLSIDSAVWLRPRVGDSFSVVIEASPLHDEETGDWGVALSFIDSSAQFACEQRLRLATSAAELGIWEYDLKNGRLECDEGMCRLYGIDPATFGHASEGWVEAPESESLDTKVFGHTFEEWAQALLTKSREAAVAEPYEAVASRTPFDIQMEIRRADDGSCRTLHGHAQVICDASGSPERIVGISRDITAEQEYRRQLAAAKERFAGIFEQTGSGVAVFRPVDEGRDFECIEINPASERIERITRDEVIGRRLTDCFPGVVEMGLLAALQRVARTGVPEELPLALYQDERITGWRENRIFRLSSGEVVAVCDDRTEIKRAQQESERAREQLANLTAQLPGFIYQYRLWPDGRHAFVYANGRAEQIYGVTPEQALEHPDHIYQVIYEADRGEVNRSIERSAQTLTPWCQSFRIHHPSKGTVWLEGDSTPQRLADGSTLWHGYVHDITERRRAERAEQQLREQLETRKHDLEAIFAAAESVSLIKTDLNSVILEASTGAEALFGYHREELIGRHISLLHTDADSARLPGYAESLFCEHQPVRMETEQVRRDGSTFPALLTIHPITDINGELVAALGVSFDISEQTRTAQDLAEAVTAKTYFLNAVSHDLRTPLNAIIGFTDLLAESSLSAEQRRHVELCQSAGRTLLGLIDTLLDLSRLEARRITLHKEAFLLSELLAEKMPILEKQAKDEGLDLQYSVDSNLPELLFGDVTRFGQVLFNLVSNAIKFTDGGYVRVHFSRYDTKRLQVSIQDNGPGIPYELQRRIFEPFDRGTDEVRHLQGSGLGLAISRQLVNLMGGEIWLRSVPGQGSTFSFTAEIIGDKSELTADSAQAESGPAGNTPAAEENIAGMQVLVAEDEPTNILLIQSLLKRCGVEATVAENGQEALDIWQQAEQEFDLILLDMQMPVLNGAQTVMEMRKAEAEQNRGATPVAMLSAHATAEVREQCLQSGADTYMTKPVRLDSLSHLLAWAKKRSGKNCVNG